MTYKTRHLNAPRRHWREHPNCDGCGQPKIGDYPFKPHPTLYETEDGRSLCIDCYTEKR